MNNYSLYAVVERVVRDRGGVGFISELQRCKCMLDGYFQTCERRHPSCIMLQYVAQVNHSPDELYFVSTEHTLQSLLRAYLSENRFAGLINVEDECHCSCTDLGCCGEIKTACRAAVLVQVTGTAAYKLEPFKGGN